MKIQIILPPTKTNNNIHDVLNDFDFDICRMGFDGDHFYLYERALSNFTNKKITINKLNYPVSALRRISKYGSYGYNIDAGIARQIYDCVKNNDFNEEHLIGYID